MNTTVDSSFVAFPRVSKALQWQEHHKDKISSTQDWAKEHVHLLERTKPMIFIAQEQSGGYGTRARSWISPRGGVYLTISCIPSPEKMTVEPLSLRIGRLLLDILISFAENQKNLLRIKPPNDLLCDNKKFGGILCQNAFQALPYDENELNNYYLIGIGLNLTNPQIKNEVTDQPTTDLASYGIQVDRELFLEKLKNKIAEELLL